MTDTRPRSPAVARNRDPIRVVLETEMADSRAVLEIGSGTGEHAVYFARHLPWLTWQPSDRAENLPGIRQWIVARPAPNLLEPLALDVANPPTLLPVFDTVFSANTAHIMHPEQVAQMFALAASRLEVGQRFYLYGPFRRNGEFTSDSDRRFDQSLREQDPGMGIRNIESLDELGSELGLCRQALHAMPANNFIAVWRREAAAD